MKGEKVPGDTTGSSPSKLEWAGDKCVKCGSPRTLQDVEACKQANVGRISYCASCIPEHIKKKAGLI
jgi:hypothetical protein